MPVFQGLIGYSNELTKAILKIEGDVVMHISSYS